MSTELIHRIDPQHVSTLCAADGNWRAVNVAAGVTCPECQRLQARPAADEIAALGS